jgi:hypothetical protein
MGFSSACGSGSGRIRNYYQDPATKSELESVDGNVLDQDPQDRLFLGFYMGSRSGVDPKLLSGSGCSGSEMNLK